MVDVSNEEGMKTEQPKHLLVLWTAKFTEVSVAPLLSLEVIPRGLIVPLPEMTAGQKHVRPFGNFGLRVNVKGNVYSL